MKKIFLSLLAICLIAASFAQVENPVKWKFSAKKTGADVYTVTLVATIAKPWHIYSQTTGKGGPVPTLVSFNTNPLISLDGKVVETGKISKTFDKNFNTNVSYIANTATYTQKVKVRAGVKTNVTGKVNFMVCDDSKCLPPSSTNFDIKLQ